MFFQHVNSGLFIMDLKAGLPINGSSTVNLQPNPGTASSATTSGQNPPTVQSFDRWHEMPADITFQVMHWMMLNERSISAPASFTMTPKAFYKAGQAFRGHPLYASAQAILLHPRLVNCSRSFLDSLGYRPRYPGIKNPEELISLLDNLSKDDGEPRPMYYLKLGEVPETTIFDSRVEQVVRGYEGKSLSLWSNGDRSANRLVSHIAKTLPTSADLNLYLDLENLEGKEVAEFCSNTCTHGHITSIGLRDFENSTSNPEVRQALMNVLCGDGLVSLVVFESLKTTDMLKELTARFQEIRHLQLLSIAYQNGITHSDVQALVAAIEQRHTSGQSRITVTLGLPYNPKPGPDSVSFSKEKMLELEGLGLFFGRLEGSHDGAIFLNKVRASIGGGPIGNYINHSRFAPASEAEASESSDVMAETGNEELYVRLYEDNFPEDENKSSHLPPEDPQSRTGQKPPSQADAPEPVKKKQDRCVIS
jgi:hypothetical protein